MTEATIGDKKMIQLLDFLEVLSLLQGGQWHFSRDLTYVAFGQRVTVRVNAFTWHVSVYRRSCGREVLA